MFPQRPLPEHPPFRPGDGTRPDEIEREAWALEDIFAEGVDLFHAGYFWEAHEAWEHVWHEADDGSPLESVVRGLIRTCAAHVKRRQGIERGLATHRRGAQAHLEGVPETVEFGSLRIDVESLRRSLQRDELPRVLPIQRP